MARRVPDVEKISQLTGWRSQRNLAQVLDDVIAEVRSERVAYAVTGDE
jgi:nucleoside-diphosphate-sugar epimerase